MATAPTSDERRRPPDLHLRAILERLPVALLRIDAKGTLLAVNQVGLGLLGGHSLEHALGTSFLSLVAEDGRESCRQLLESASNGQDGSAEVELRGLTGTVRAVELHAVTHPGAPDAAPSAMVTLRDVTQARVLAQSLETASARQADVERAQLAQHAALTEELERLRATLSSQSSGDDARAAVESRLTKALEDIENLNRRCGALASEKQQATVDLQIREIRVNELTVQLADLERTHAAKVEQLMTAHAAGSSEAEAALSAATAREQDARAALQRAEAAFAEERQQFADERQRSADDRQRLESEKQQVAAEAQAHQTRVKEFTVQFADLERSHATKVEELRAAHAAQASEAAAALAAAADERQRWSDDRQRLESEAAAARDAEGAARAAWTHEQTERLDADRTRQQLVDAIARLAVEAGLPLSADVAVSIDAGDRGDGASTSAW